MPTAVPLARRAFLARIGVLGAALGGGGLLARGLLAPADAATNRPADQRPARPTRLVT